MADIKVRIEVNPNQETEFLGDIQNQVGTSGSVENISNVSIKSDSLGVYSNIPTIQNAITGINGLSLGQDLVFDENGYLDNQNLQGAVIEDEQNPDEFVWGVVPESGEYHVKLTFINAQNLKDIVVKGDDVVGQFPTQAIVDGQTTIYSDDSKWAINFQTESNTHTIEFTHWNRTNYNACLTLIAVMLRYFEVDKYNGLKSVESLSQSTGQPKEIFYGVVPSSGSLEIIDVNGEIREMIESGVMPNSNVNIDVFANGNRVQQHISEDSSYESNSKLFNVSLTSNLQDWNNIKYAGLGIQLNKMTLYEILQQIFKATLNIDDIDFMLGNQMYYGSSDTRGTVKDYLQLIEIPNPFLEESTLNDAIIKICTIAQLTVIKDNDGIIQFLPARPKMVSNETILCIPAKMQDTQPIKDLILKNKYINCNVETYNVQKEINNETLAVSYDIENISSSLDYPATIDSDSREDNSGELESVARVQCSYVEGSFDFVIGQSNAGQNYYVQKLQSVDDGILNITIDNVPELYEDNKYVSFNSNYTLYSYDGTVQGNYYLLIPEITNIRDQWNDYQPNDIELQETQQSGVFGGSISAKVEISSQTLASVSLKDETTISIVQNNNNTYTCNYKILSNKDEISASLFYPFQEPNSTTLNRTIKQYRSDSITINLLGTKIIFNFNSNNETQSNTNNYTYNLTTNELMQDKATYRNQNLSNLIEQNIIKDYSNGIATIDMSIKCLDVYDINNKLVYEFSKGDILNIGDIVRIDKDNDDNSLYKYSNNKDMYFEVTGRTFRKSGVPLIDLELRETKPLFNSISFAEDSWELIDQIAQSGMANQYYSVGDEKTITLTTGEQLTLVIVGFNHDDLTSGVKAPITIGMKDCLDTTYRINPSSNVTSWNESEMRTETLQTIFSQLPTDLQEIIKNVNKRTSIGRDGISISSDNLWLFSRVEIDNTTTNYYADEGMQYEYWRTIKNGEVATDRIKSNNWWLRSNYYNPPFNYGFDSYVYIYQNNGDFLAGLAYNSAGISFGFCI